MEGTQEPIYGPLLEKLLSGIAHGSVMVKENWTSFNSVILEASFHANEIGILMGQGAKNIKAIQTIFRIIGEKRKDKVSVALEPEGEKTGLMKGFKQFHLGDAEDLFHELLVATGWTPQHFRYQENSRGIELLIFPQLTNELLNAFNTVAAVYGKSHETNLRINDQREVTP